MLYDHFTRHIYGTIDPLKKKSHVCDVFIYFKAIVEYQALSFLSPFTMVFLNVNIGNSIDIDLLFYHNFLLSFISL